MLDYKRYKKYKRKYKNLIGAASSTPQIGDIMINIAAIGKLSCVGANTYGTDIGLQEGDTGSYGTTEAQILIFINEAGLLLRTFTLQEMIDLLSTPKTKQELRYTISDNRDQGVIDDISYENSQGGEYYIDNGDYEITANNAENILENPERETINFLSQYALQYNGSCWENYKFDNTSLR